MGFQIDEFFSVRLFVGENAESWLAIMEADLEELEIPLQKQVSYACQFLSGNTQAWFKKNLYQLCMMNWGEFSSMVCGEFGKLVEKEDSFINATEGVSTANDTFEEKIATVTEIADVVESTGILLDNLTEEVQYASLNVVESENDVVGNNKLCSVFHAHQLFDEMLIRAVRFFGVGATVNDVPCYDLEQVMSKKIRLSDIISFDPGICCSMTNTDSLKILYPRAARFFRERTTKMPRYMCCWGEWWPNTYTFLYWLRGSASVWKKVLFHLLANVLAFQSHGDIWCGSGVLLMLDKEGLQEKIFQCCLLHCDISWSMTWFDHEVSEGMVIVWKHGSQVFLIGFRHHIVHYMVTIQQSADSKLPAAAPFVRTYGWASSSHGLRSFFLPMTEDVITGGPFTSIEMQLCGLCERLLGSKAYNQLSSSRNGALTLVEVPNTVLVSAADNIVQCVVFLWFRAAELSVKSCDCESLGRYAGMGTKKLQDADTASRGLSREALVSRRGSASNVGVQEVTLGVDYLSLLVLTLLYTNPHGLHRFSKDGKILQLISSDSLKNVSSQMFEKSGTHLLCGAMNGLVLVLDIVLTTPFDWLVRQISLKPMKCYLVTHLLWIRCTGCPYCACVWPLSGILLHQKDKSVVCISYVTIDAALQLLVPVQKECDQSGTVNFSISYCCLNTMERGSLRYTIYISNTLLVCSSFSMCRCSSFVQKDDNKPAKEGLEQNCGEFQYFSGVVFCSARVYIARNIHNRTHEDIRGQILLLELLHMLLSRLVIRHFMSHMPMYNIVEIRAAIIQVFELVSSQVRINNLRFIASIHYHSTVHQLEALEYIIIQVSSTELQGSFGGKEGLAAVQQYWYFAVILPMWCLDTGEQACIWNIITTFPAELCYGQLWQHTSNTNVVLNDLAVQLGISAMPLLVKGSCYPLTVAAISCGIKKRSRMIPISILLVSREKEGACFHLGGGTLDVFHGPLEEVNEALLGLLLELRISVTSHLRAQDVAKDSVPSTTPATVISMVESRNKPTTYSDMTCYVFFDVVIFKGGSYTRKNVQQNLAWLMHNSGQRDLCILKLTGYKEFSYSGKLGRLYYAMHLYIGWAWSLHQVQYFSSLVIRTWVLFLWVIAWGTLGIFWCHSVSLCMVEDRIADDTRVMTDEYFVHKVVLLGGYRRCSKVQQFRQNHLIGPGTSKLIKAKEVINQGSTVVGVLVSEEEGLKCDADGRRSEDARQAMHVGKSKLPSLRTRMLSRPGYCHDPSPMSISSMRTWIFSSTRHCHEPNHDPAQE